MSDKPATEPSGWKDRVWGVLPRLLTGNAVAQAIGLAAIPLISRVYAPGPIAVWSTALVLSNLLWSFSQLRMDVALFQGRTQAEKTAMLDIGIAAHLFFSLAASILLGWWGYKGILQWSNWAWIGAGLVSTGLYQMALQWLASERRFDLQNRVRILWALLSYPAAVLLFYFSPQNGLLIAMTLGSLAPVLWLFGAGKMPLPFRHFSGSSVKTALSAHRNTAIFLPLGNLLMSLSEQALVLLIMDRYRAEEAAAVFMAMRICGAPLSLVQGAIGPYNYRYFQDLFDSGKLRVRHFTRHWMLWSAPALVFFGLIALFGPVLFSWLLGTDWTLAGQAAAAIAAWACVKFLNSPTSMGMFVTGNQRTMFVFTVSFALTLPLGYFMAKAGTDLMDMLRVFTAVQIVLLVVYNVWMLRLVNLKTRLNHG